jgi:hypothetical protein
MSCWPEPAAETGRQSTISMTRIAPSAVPWVWSGVIDTLHRTLLVQLVDFVAADAQLFVDGVELR